MFGSIGGQEIVLIMALALLLFGPRRLPEIGRSIGQTLSQLRRTATDFKMDLEREINTEKIKETHRSIKSAGQEVSRAVNEVTRVDLDADDRNSRPNRAVGQECDPAPGTTAEPASADEGAARPERPGD